MQYSDLRLYSIQMINKFTLLIIIQSFLFFKPSVGQEIIITPIQTSITQGDDINFGFTLDNLGTTTQQLFFNIESTTLPVGEYTSAFTPPSLNFPYTGGSILNIQTVGSMECLVLL
jgi:hypothetical protein